MAALLARVLILAAAAATAKADLAAVEQYIAENKDHVDSRYRLLYHVAPQIGWMNDPNGFSYYNGQYHLFHQFYPYDSAWGPMHWGHLVSDNLIDWAYFPTALEPVEPYDKDGCYSGSGVEIDGQLALIYTGVNGSMQTQNLALSSDGITFTKYEGNPTIASPPDGNWEFRDPKVWWKDDAWYMVVGSQTLDGRGRVVLYKSDDLRQWSYVGPVGESSGDLGYMWECPDIFELNGRHVLLMSPQGVEAEGNRFKNLHQTGYFVGDLNYSTGIFSGVSFSKETLVELDYGHDFYATQTTLTADGRRVVIGWMAMWEQEFPEAADGWAGAMTLPRELTLGSDGAIRMNPIREALLLRTTTLREETLLPGEGFNSGMAAFELEVYASIGGIVSLEFYSGEDLVYSASWSNGLVTVEKNGDERGVEWSPAGDLYWRVFVDTSSVELFCGDGEAVFTSRVYPATPGELYVLVAGDTSARVLQHALRRSIGG